MKTLTTIVALASLAGGAPLTAQQATQPSAGQDSQAPSAATKKNAADYVHDLGSDSFKLRTQAERALRAMGKDALPELEKAVADQNEPEAQWRARRLVRQIQGGGGGLARRERDDDASAQRGGGRAFGWPGNDDIQQRFDQLFQGLESDFGFDIPRGRFFHDDFFRDLQQQMQDLRQQVQQGQGSGQSMSMQMGPDGVRVEIKTKNDKGAEESKVYEAPDLESFQQKYPGVLQQHGLGGGLQMFHLGDGFPNQFQLQTPRLQWLTPRRSLRTAPGAGSPAEEPKDDVDSADAPVAVAPPADRRLGVIVRPQIADDVREYLGIDGGLMVEEVQPDTLASELQLAKGDIVLEIAGKSIASTKDVQDALGPIDAGARVEVKILRRGKELQLHADKPKASEAAPAPLERRKEADGRIR